MTVCALGSFSVHLDGALIATGAPVFVTGEVDAPAIDLPAFEPLELTFDLSPDLTGAMPDFVKRTRRSRRRWRGKGRAWRKQWRGWF